MRRKTHPEFISQVAGRPFDVLGEYSTAKTPIRFRCHIDGHVWSVTPSNVLTGHGCAICAIRDRAATQRKSNDTFVDQIAGSPFDVMDEYRGVHAKIRFRCCIDGNKWLATPGNILNGGGCPECVIRNLRGSNDIMECNGDTVVIDVSTHTYPRATSRMMYSDLLRINRHGRIAIRTDGYCCVNVKGISKLVHRIIMGTTDEHTDTDHKNGIRTDNRRSNLRKCTRSQNLMNKRMQTNNTSGYIGVSWDKRRTKWLAQIAVNHKHINLGRYTNKAAAIAARKAAEKKYFGEFAYSESQDATMQHNPKR